jgi:hypothetical protein
MTCIGGSLERPDILIVLESDGDIGRNVTVFFKLQILRFVQTRE